MAKSELTESSTLSFYIELLSRVFRHEVMGVDSNRLPPADLENIIIYIYNF